MSSSDALRIQYADPVDPWEMLDTPWGHIPAWKAATIATGTMGSAMEAYEQVRNDSASIVARQDAREAALAARADALDQRERAIGVMAAQVADLAGRMSVRWDKLQKVEADQEHEAKEPFLPPGHEISQEPEPSMELEDAALPGDPSPPTGSEPALTPQKQVQHFGTSPLKHPTIPPVLDGALMDVLQPARMPVAAGFDKADGD